VSRWRHLLPVSSPLSAAALLAGVRVAAGNGKAAAAVRQLDTLVRERYTPAALLLTDSGTTALRAALVATLAGRTGAAVALPAFSCYDLATAAEGAGVPVVLYDTDPQSLTPDLASLRRALRLGAAVVVVVHLYGCAFDLAEVNHLAAEFGAVVIEDAAQAAGGMVQDRPAGTQSSLAVLSFGRGKGMTGGSGGALLAHDAVGVDIVERARRLLGPARRGWSDLGAVTAQLMLEPPRLYAVPAALPLLHLGETVYRDPHAPRAASPVSCALVAATWTMAAQEVGIRQRNAERLLERLASAGRGRAFGAIQTSAAARPGYLRLPVLAAPEARRAAGEGSARRLGIMPAYPKVLGDLDGFAARCANRDAAFPGARTLVARLCTLPTHGRLGERDLAALEQWIDVVAAREPRV